MQCNLGIFCSSTYTTVSTDSVSRQRRPRSACLTTFYKRQLLWRPVCFPTDQVPSEKLSTLKEKNLLPWGSKFFSVRGQLFRKEQNNFDKVVSFENPSVPLMYPAGPATKILDQRLNFIRSLQIRKRLKWPFSVIQSLQNHLIPLKWVTSSKNLFGFTFTFNNNKTESFSIWEWVDSDHPVHWHSLLKAFALDWHIIQYYPVSRQWRPWSDWKCECCFGLSCLHWPRKHLFTVCGPSHPY